MRSRSNGNVYLIVLVLLVIVAGSWQYSEYTARKKREEAERVEAERLRQETIRQQAEQAELERRLAVAQAEKDAMASTLSKVDDIAVRWGDARRVAGVTSRIALSAPVANMQSLRREVDSLIVPPCLDSGIEALKRSMDTTIDAYVTFMVEKGDAGNRLTGALLDMANEQFDLFKESRAECI